MDGTEKIIVAGEELEIPVKPITPIFQDGTMRIDYPKRVPLMDRDTIYHVTRVKKLHPIALEYFHIIFPHILEGYTQDDTEGETWFHHPTEASVRFTEWIRFEGGGVQHALGLMDMTLKLSDMGVGVAWIHPESHLHPSASVNLGDVLIRLMKEYAPPREPSGEESDNMEK